MCHNDDKHQIGGILCNVTLTCVFELEPQLLDGVPVALGQLDDGIDQHRLQGVRVRQQVRVRARRAVEELPSRGEEESDEDLLRGV